MEELKIYNYEDSLREILVVTLGSNKGLRKTIDKIYSKKENQYYEMYLENREPYEYLKQVYSDKVEDYINKVIGIYEVSEKNNDFTDILAMIKKAYNKLYRELSSGVKLVNIDYLILKFLKSKDVVSITQGDMKGYIAATFFLIDYFDLESEGEGYFHRLAMIERELLESQEIRFKINNFKDMIGKNIENSYKDVYIEREDIQNMLEIENLLSKIVYNSMNRRSIEMYDKPIKKLNSEMMKNLIENTHNHEDTIVAHVIDTYFKFFKSSDMDIKEFMSDVYIGKNRVDELISFTMIMKDTYGICKDKESNILLFISLLFIDTMINYYKDLKHVHLDSSKEEYYLKIKNKENTINEKEKQLDENVKIYNAKLEEKNRKISDLEEEIKRLRKENSLLNNEIKEKQDNSKEVIALRDYVYNSTENYKENIEEITEKEKIELISKSKVALFGGRLSTINKLKDILPDYKYIGVENINLDMKFISGLDYVVVCTNYLSHAIYNKLISNIKDSNVKLIYVDDVNVNLIINNIYDNICSSNK